MLYRKRLILFLVALVVLFDTSCATVHPGVREVCLPTYSGLWECDSADGSSRTLTTHEMSGKFGAFPIDDIGQCFHLEPR